jgi:superfamily II DNA helicase RecQ
VCPLNSIIEDQLSVLRDRNITADVLQLAENREPIENLFGEHQESSEPKLQHLPEDLVNGNTSIIFAHPESLLSKEGRKLMGSKVFQENVVSIVVDEAHCVNLW